MAKLNIIVSSLNPELFTTKRLMGEATKLKHSALYINPYQFQVPLKSQKMGGLYFHRTTGTNYDDFDLVVTKHHADMGMTVTNPIEALSLFRTKDSQSLFFNFHKIPSIKTMLYRGVLTEEMKQSLSDLSKNGKYILKMSRGNQGIGVNFLESKKSLMSILETFHAMRDQRFMIQPFVEHTREWRLFIVRGEVLACIEKKISSEDFRGNSKRSTAKYLKKIPAEIESIALHAFSKSHLHYAGIDLLETKDKKILVLEVNAIPGFEQAEELSGRNLARELLIAH